MADEANTEPKTITYIPMTLDFSRISLEFDCAKNRAAEAVKDGLNQLKGKLAGLTSSADGVFTEGASIAGTVGGDITGLIRSAKQTLGEIETGVISLRESVAEAILTWQIQGAEAAAKAFDDIKQKFPSFDPNTVIDGLSAKSNTVLIFSFCDTVKDQTIADGRSEPLDVPKELPAPSTDAVMSIPEIQPIPDVKIPDPILIPLEQMIWDEHRAKIREQEVAAEEEKIRKSSLVFTDE